MPGHRSCHCPLRYSSRWPQATLSPVWPPWSCPTRSRNRATRRSAKPTWKSVLCARNAVWPSPASRRCWRTSVSATGRTRSRGARSASSRRATSARPAIRVRNLRVWRRWGNTATANSIRAVLETRRRRRPSRPSATKWRTWSIRSRCWRRGRLRRPAPWTRTRTVSVSRRSRNVGSWVRATSRNLSPAPDTKTRANSKHHLNKTKTKPPHT